MLDSVDRPEIHRTPLGPEQFGVVRQKFTLFETLYGQGWLRKSLLLILLAGVWEVYGRWLDDPLLVPTFSDTVAALIAGIASGELIGLALTSLRLLLMGYAIGVLLAAVLTMFAIGTRIGTDLLETMTAMFNPLPAIALLPLALIWFGLGAGSVIFVLVHSVLWSMALNMHAGFRAVSPTLRMVGRNYGLRGLRFVFGILVPAAFPSILAGLQIGWAFAWRTLIAAELVFGVTSGHGGLGWFIFESKTRLDIPAVFAGLLSIILIGLLIENVVFRLVESHTIQRWGMSS